MNRRPTGVIPRDQLLKMHIDMSRFEFTSKSRWLFTIGECMDRAGLSEMDFIADHDAQWTTFQFLSELDLDRARVFAQLVDAKLTELAEDRKARRTRVYLDL